MKRIFLSLFAVAVLFSACGNDDVQNPSADGGGTLKVALAFEGAEKAALSSAIPTTTWAKVKQVQMFLYNKTTGAVAYSATVTPNDGNQNFTWTSIPAGTYDLALVANMKSTTDAITTSVGSLVTEWTDNNVKTKTINGDLVADLKPSTFLATDVPAVANKAYCSPSEIFTVYKRDVVISDVAPTVLTSAELKLKREVGMMRIRINPAIPSANGAKFTGPEAAVTSITIQRQPVGFGLQLGTFAGGINAASDPNRIVIAASGVNTYNDAEPTSGYGVGTIRDAQFTLWKDILVLPNTTKAENITSGPVDPSRRYFIRISAWAPAGYVFDNQSVKQTAGPIYWWGTVLESFLPNKIREVNLTLKTLGDPGYPTIPEEIGTLDITVGVPEDWNPVIDRADYDL